MDAYRRLQNNLFGVRRSIRYHERRRAFFEAVNTWILACQVVVSSSFGALVLLGSSQYTEFGSVVVALVGALAAVNLVVGSHRRAFAHASLSQRFAQLEQFITPNEHDKNVDLDVVSEFRRRRLAIEEDEPPKMRIIDLLCHNELVVSSYQHMLFYRVRLRTRFIGRFIDIEVNKKILKSGTPYEELLAARQHTTATQ